MFEQSLKPRVFGLPPGADFATALVRGLTDRAGSGTPENLSRVQIYVNTSRMQRRIRDVFDAGPARLLPRVRLITDLAFDPAAATIPAPVSPLRRRLELSRFVAALLEKEPDLAPKTALFDLSDSLAGLMDEMQGEGVSPDAICSLDVTDQSGHWDRAQRFLNIIAPYFGDAQTAPDKEARQRLVISALAMKWETAPPDHPIIVAGSTGSRGATGLFIRAVANLPQGAVVLPGFDFDLPQQVWDAMDDPHRFEDHPQFRFRRLMDQMDLSRADIVAWEPTPPPCPARNRLVSLALRPAPVTDQWLVEGPRLDIIAQATDGMTLVEAASPRAEAEAIALRLRKAAEDGVTAALITPDRMLTRQVAAALDRWDITPDDSAGVPLALSPPGRILRHVADMLGSVVAGEGLLVLLKHPLCHSNRADRGQHLRRTRELELHLRRYGPAFPVASDITAFAAKTGSHDPERLDWAHWVGAVLDHAACSVSENLNAYLEHHLALAELVCAGPDCAGAGGLWETSAGREARRICDMIQRDGDAAGEIATRDYVNLFGAILSQGVVRNRDTGHPQILIWGTLEARVQGADLVILGGMNEGVSPEAPAPDPWLNRMMRAKVGLLLPERRIGLSAHDFQQAVAGREVWITRAKRSADAQTVPSRWVNRLLNLLNGLGENGGPEAVQAMQVRGENWLRMSAHLGEPAAVVAKAPRPSPRPPIDARPTELSVTKIKTLIRDPYAVYGEKVLQLRALDPLVPTADAPLRGVIIHKVLERFVDAAIDATQPDARDRIMQLAQEEFVAQCPWPTVREQWLARLDRGIDNFLVDEVVRQASATKATPEANGRIIVGDTGVTLTCKADRIDTTADDHALIYDYKTGTVPTAAVQKQFDLQLLLEAAMVERGAFDKVPALPVDEAVFIGVNSKMDKVAAPLDALPADLVWANFQGLLRRWQEPTRGYTARMAMLSEKDAGYYDHLSRFGEWDITMPPKPEDLT